jgi:hypothetical protein
VHGVIREPIDRIISCAWNISVRKLDVLNTNNKVVEYFLTEMDRSSNMPWTQRTLYLNQTFWLTHNGSPISHIVKYDELDNFANQIIGDDVLKYNFRSKIRLDKSKDLSEELQKEIRIRYSEDFALWESLQPPAPQP